MQPVPTPFTEILIKHLLSKLLIQKRGKLQAPEFGTAISNPAPAPISRFNTSFHHYTSISREAETQKYKQSSFKQKQTEDKYVFWHFFLINLSYRNINCTNTQKKPNKNYIVYFKIPSQSGRYFIINHLRVHNYVLRGFFIIIINEAK